MSTQKKVDFSKDLSELESIVEWFESGDIDLDEALVKFERGMELAVKLKTHLKTVENKVVKIKQKFNQPNNSVTNGTDTVNESV